jgi:pilus assembly protein CpaE
VQDILDGRIEPAEEDTERDKVTVIEKVRYVRNRTVSAVSPTGGTGKTTVLASLAVAAAARSRGPVVIADFSASGNMAAHLGLGLFAVDFVVPTLQLWSGPDPGREALFDEFLIQHPDLENLYLLPAALTYDIYRSLTDEQMKRALQTLRRYSEIIFLDVSGERFPELVAEVDAWLLVVSTDLVSLAEMRRLQPTLARLGLAERIKPVAVERSGGLARHEVRRAVEEALTGVRADAFLPCDDALAGISRVKYMLSRSTPYTRGIEELLAHLFPDLAQQSGGGLLRAVFGRLRK